MTLAAALDKAVKAVAPIEGVSIGNEADKTTWKLQFAPAATPAQKTAAQGVVTAFVYDPAAEAHADNQTLLNAALIEKGSLFRANAMLTFKEINKLRVKTGDQPYTMQVYIAALLAEMEA